MHAELSVQGGGAVLKYTFYAPTYTGSPAVLTEYVGHIQYSSTTWSPNTVNVLNYESHNVNGDGYLIFINPTIKVFANCRTMVDGFGNEGLFGNLYNGIHWPRKLNPPKTLFATINCPGTMMDGQTVELTARQNFLAAGNINSADAFNTVAYRGYINADPYSGPDDPYFSSKFIVTFYVRQQVYGYAPPLRKVLMIEGVQYTKNSTNTDTMDSCSLVNAFGAATFSGDQQVRIYDSDNGINPGGYGSSVYTEFSTNPYTAQFEFTMNTNGFGIVYIPTGTNVVIHISE